MKKSGETEEKIIKAATDVFMEKGKDGARMQEIADKAGINKALLHYYFRSKEKLFTKIFNLEIPKVVTNILDAIDDTTDFQDFLHIFINRYIDNVALRKNLLRFILWISEKAKIEIAQVFLKAFESKGFDKNPIVAKVENAIETKQIRPVDPVNFAISLIGMCIFPIIAAPIVDKIFPVTDITGKQFIENRKKEIFDLLWNGVKAE